MFEEPVINVELARILNNYGFSYCNPQILTCSKKPDIFLIANGVRIIIEGGHNV